MRAVEPVVRGEPVIALCADHAPVVVAGGFDWIRASTCEHAPVFAVACCPPFWTWRDAPGDLQADNPGAVCRWLRPGIARAPKPRALRLVRCDERSPDLRHVFAQGFGAHRIPLGAVRFGSLRPITGQRIRLCYVAAPFGAPTRELQAWNTWRAVALADLAGRRGFLPVVVHPLILEGLWGDDNDPDVRAAGLRATLAIASAVVEDGGVVWALTHDDGTLSPGVAGEVQAAARSGERATCYSWAAWARTFPGLVDADAWARLAVPP